MSLCTTYKAEGGRGEGGLLVPRALKGRSNESHSLAPQHVVLLFSESSQETENQSRKEGKVILAPARSRQVHDRAAEHKTIPTRAIVYASRRTNY